ncbi:MAG: hypothetical protein ABI687_12555 [Flavitalea sp.]
MHLLLFIFYLIALSFLVTRSRFLSSSRLSPYVLVSVFILYSAAGCLHVWIAYHYFPHQGDIWNLYRDSLQMKKEMLADFRAFSAYYLPTSFTIDMTGKYSGWSYLQYQGIRTIHLIFNFLSFDNLYINTLLFCFVTLWGKIALFRMLDGITGGNNITVPLLAIALPGTLFWTSVVHKEGILFAALGFLSYCCWKLLNNKGGGKDIAVIMLSLAAIFFTRKILLVSLLPALALWVISAKTAYRTKYIFLAVTIGSFALLAVLAAIHPAFDILYQLSDRQVIFQQMDGASRMKLPLLEQGWKSLLAVFPYAVFNGLFMPLPGTGGQILYAFFGLEIVMIWIIVAYTVYYLYIKKKSIWFSGFDLYCLIFSLSALLLIGYVIPFAGAIVRYKSICYPFLLIPFMKLLQAHPLMRRWHERIKAKILR